MVLLMQGSLYCCCVCSCYTLMFLGWKEGLLISLCVYRVMITIFSDLLGFDYLIMGSKEINYLLDITLPHS